MNRVFERWCKGLQLIETYIKETGYEFMWNPHLGYILTCPSNLGTGVRAGVHLKVPLTSQNPKFDEALKKLRLQKRGTGEWEVALEGGKTFTKRRCSTFNQLSLFIYVHRQ